MLIKEKRWKEIAVYLFLGIVVASPFLIRNVMISGWLVYPFTGIDLFSVDWKIPEGIAAYDAKEIQVWGRGYSDVTAYDMPFWKWLPAWYEGIGGMDRLFVPTAFIAVIAFTIRFIRNVAHMQDKLLVEGVLSLSFIFWLVTSPLIRYGCVYVYLTSAVVLGDVFVEFTRADSKKILQNICIAAVGVFLLYKTVAFGRELVTTYVNDYWLCQKDYDNYETLSYEIGGITFYYPAEGDRVGYESFPSSPVKVKLGLRGHSIEDGFYYLE